LSLGSETISEMKTETVNLSLPRELAEFARQDMTLGAYSTISEYVRELIRQRRQARIEADVKFLEEAISGASQSEPPQEFFDEVSAIQRRIRSEKKSRG
jgi:antitoxin ParD1/3/4